jgi:hypothetical protein
MREADEGRAEYRAGGIYKLQLPWSQAGQVRYVLGLEASLTWYKDNSNTSSVD